MLSAFKNVENIQNGTSSKSQLIHFVWIFWTLDKNRAHNFVGRLNSEFILSCLNLHKMDSKAKLQANINIAIISFYIPFETVSIFFRFFSASNGLDYIIYFNVHHHCSNLLLFFHYSQSKSIKIYPK